MRVYRFFLADFPIKLFRLSRTNDSSSRDRMEVIPGQMSAGATAFAKKNGVPDYANGETASSSPQTGSVSPSKMEATMAMV